MNNEIDWIFVDNANQLTGEFEIISMDKKTDEEEFDMEPKRSYNAAILLNNVQYNNQNQQRTVSSFEQKKEKPTNKQDDDLIIVAPYMESKAGHQYYDPREKVHDDRRYSISSPTNLSNSSKVVCSSSNPKLSNRVKHKRNKRQ